MRFFTYYEPISRADEPVVDLCVKEWGKLGFKVEVLSEKDANGWEAVDLNEKAKNFPTVNDHGFERQCYLRWSAIERATSNKDQSVFLDYDVFPNWNWNNGLLDKGWGFTNFDAQAGPGFIVGWRRNFKKITSVIYDYECCGTEMHVSDMTIIRAYSRDLFDSQLDMMRCYRTRGWEDKPLIHFGNGYLEKKKPKHEEIADVLALTRSWV